MYNIINFLLIAIQERMKLPPRALISLLSTKVDWQIPHEVHIGKIHEPTWSTLAKNNNAIEIAGAEKYPNLKNSIKQYMQETFYNTAPIPKALGLSNTSCNYTDSLINDEVNNAVDSGASILFTKATDNVQRTPTIVGCWLNQLWSKNSEYQIIGANARVWHDAAAEIAMNHPNKAIHHLIWRKLQFLHIYDLAQILLNQMPQKKYVIYLGAGFVDNDLRSHDVMEEAFSIIHNDWKTKDCIIYMMTTFSSMEPLIKKRLHDPVVVDEVKFEDEMLELNGGRCFKSCEKLGGIKFFANFNEKEKSVDYNSFPEG